jgi:hypothetical protein
MKTVIKVDDNSGKGMNLNRLLIYDPVLRLYRVKSTGIILYSIDKHLEYIEQQMIGGK